MSFRRKTGPTKVDYKARLEHKLYLAKMSPSSVYDISECNLENVPSSTYILCEVLRKEALLLHCNRLKSLSSGGALKNLSLISILDIHSNELQSLPSEIVSLVSLKELYLHENKIQKLPNEIVSLKNLIILDVSSNKLKCLPEDMGNLKNLLSLNIGHNKALQKLPKSLGHAQKINYLGIDNLNLEYPPEDILSGGTIVIIAFLANECGINFSPEDSKFETEVFKDLNPHDMQAFHHDKDNEIQEQRLNSLVEVEENIKLQQRQELLMQEELKMNKQKLLHDLAWQQTQLEEEIKKIQLDRDVSRKRLLSYIHNAEKEADSIIKEFLDHGGRERLTQSQLLEKEKKEEFQLLSHAHSQQSSHRTRDTLLAMKELLEEVLFKGKKLAEYAAERKSSAESILSLEVENNEQLLQVMLDQERSRQDLVDELKRNDKLQKAVVAALLERSDTRSWSIHQQVNLVQSQLGNLTNVELEKKKLEVDQQINDVAEKRVTLSAILIELLEQQEKRKQELLDTVKCIEQQRDPSNLSKQDDSFWLAQYQSVVETRPQGLLETLDPSLVRYLATAGALHCLPFLSTLPSLLPNITDDQLKSMGIKSEIDRKAIIIAIENFVAEQKLNNHDHCVPSAPPEEPSTSSSEPSEKFAPSAPTECIVCMDLECDVIFLPCGHFCCCATCTAMLSKECPMCRSIIERKIRVSGQ
ncbi:hypothetical protein QAD02_010196 [Eretmocerus hayati]|uniref:Uncharacterized protein n=1 Tax=Eretmocerus hayati TaxID=131215 RepID=A0ACC2NC64_9HYME|nr:hypothetical protein QAD02_010196 [Eretmocerus hayati]